MNFMPKTTSINLRISPEFRQELEMLAEYHGLTMSSYAHSLLVKAVRHERHTLGAELMTTKGIRAATVKMAPVSGREEAQRMIDGTELAKQRKRKAG